jgi:hypothetical protein
MMKKKIEKIRVRIELKSNECHEIASSQMTDQTFHLLLVTLPIQKLRNKLINERLILTLFYFMFYISVCISLFVCVC